MYTFPVGSGGSTNRDSTVAPGASFELSNTNMIFAPLHYPKRIKVSKERRLSREPNFCEGEDVHDIGSKNREVYISGFIRASEVASFNALMDEHDPFDLVADEWSGEVTLLNGEYERYALDIYQYKLNLVSTGVDERGRTQPDGIIRVGRAE